MYYNMNNQNCCMNVGTEINYFKTKTKKTPKFGPHPGGCYGGQGGLSLYVGGKGR